MPSNDRTTFAEELKGVSLKVSVAVASAKPKAQIVSWAGVAGATFLPKLLCEKTLGEFVMSTLPSQVGG